MKVCGKSVQGFMSYDRTSKQLNVDRQTENISGQFLSLNEMKKRLYKKHPVFYINTVLNHWYFKQRQMFDRKV